MNINNFKNFNDFVKENQNNPHKKNIKRCIIRADLNIPSDIEDLSRIYSIKDTVISTLKLGLDIVLISHYKRPKIEDIINKKYSLCNVVDKLSNVLREDVDFIKNSIFDIDPSYIKSKITLLENLRFYEGETKDDDELARRLSCFGDIYINDAFSVSHRKHASVHSITKYLPSFAGLSLEKEISGILNNVTDNIIRPFTTIIGGSKVSSKIDVLKQLSKTSDYLIITGAMANTFLAAKGIDLKNSLIEHDLLEEAKNIMNNSKADIILPIDFMASQNINTNGKCYDYKMIPNGFSCFDIGIKTIEIIKDIIDKSKTLLWNGTLGAFEFSNFDNSSKILSKHISDRTKDYGLISIIGGGETIASIKEYKDNMTFVSNAGGAFLELVSGKNLPGLDALKI